jgi:hypothetical protein
LLNRYIYAQKQADVDEIPMPYRGTLAGEYVCLPPASGSDASECIPALQTDHGKYYVIDFMLMSQLKPDLREGDSFSASGLITPIEYLSTDHWQKYPLEIEGIFSVTDSAQKQ